MCSVFRKQDQRTYHSTRRIELTWKKWFQSNFRFQVSLFFIYYSSDVVGFNDHLAMRKNFYFREATLNFWRPVVPFFPVVVVRFSLLVHLWRFLKFRMKNCFNSKLQTVAGFIFCNFQVSSTIRLCKGFLIWHNHIDSTLLLSKSIMILFLSLPKSSLIHLFCCYILVDNYYLFFRGVLLQWRYAPESIKLCGVIQLVKLLSSHKWRFFFCCCCPCWYCTTLCKTFLLHLKQQRTAPRYHFPLFVTFNTSQTHVPSQSTKKSNFFDHVIVWWNENQLSFIICCECQHSLRGNVWWSENQQPSIV